LRRLVEDGPNAVRVGDGENCRKGHPVDGLFFTSACPKFYVYPPAREQTHIDNVESLVTEIGEGDPTGYLPAKRLPYLTRLK
jgi:hypothetical protein